MPQTATFAAAAALPIAGLTALQALRDRGRIRPGHAVLVNGASGGVGTLAVQIAKAFGAEVTAVCSTRNIDLVRGLGADHVVDYTVDDFTDTRVQFDIIIDMVANRPPSRCRRILTRDGVYVGVGAEKKGNWVGPLVGMARIALAGRLGRRSMVSMLARTNRADLATLASLVEEGKLTPHIEHTYPLAETAAALARQGEGHARGKTVITV
jgi:NADPH:quinone reductase-like Zn-dependent oxidoreductase